jgi:hypothetical protein
LAGVFAVCGRFGLGCASFAFGILFCFAPPNPKNKEAAPLVCGQKLGAGFLSFAWEFEQKKV